MSQTTTSLRARALALDAHTIAAHIDAAETNLDTAQAGWPTQCPGAAPPDSNPGSDGKCDETSFYADGYPHPCAHPLPCPEHPTGSRHIVERTAGHDTARRDLEALREHIRQATHHARAAAKIAMAHGSVRLDKSTIAERLIEATRELWCDHCATIGQRNVRAGSSNLCEFCRDFRTKWKRLPSKRIFNVRDARGGQIYPTDINRIHREEKLEADAAKAAAKAEQKRLAKEQQAS